MDTVQILKIQHELAQRTLDGRRCSALLSRMESLVHCKDARRVRASGWGSSTDEKPSASASSNWHIITGSSKALLEREVKPLVEAFLKERGLVLSVETTSITHIETGVDFLGQTIRKYPDGKIIIKPSKSNVKTFLSNVRQVIKGNKQAKAGNLIVRLNPMIRGWANYHRHVCSKQTFREIDSAIFQNLWRWARRRHPNKPRRWVKKKYFHPIGQRQWTFCGAADRGAGKPKPVQLCYAAEVAIKRHIKIKGEANPYDPDWEPILNAESVSK